MQVSEGGNEVITEVRGRVGFMTLNRPKALNALSLSMVRTLTTCLRTWRDDPNIAAVAIRGTDKSGSFGGFCAGGDIRFFYQAARNGNPELEDFFTEEYVLDHLIHRYGKPFIAFMDGICMGGGMGIGQGASLRIVTERTRMAMPETNIGLFPDVGGGYFLSRCPGRVGEWLALSGHTIGFEQALAFGLADTFLDASRLASAWDALAEVDFAQTNALEHWNAMFSIAAPGLSMGALGQIDHFFSKPTVAAIVQALELDANPWSQHTASALRQRSPLLLHVALEQIRRARSMTLEDDLRMERGLVRHCFQRRHLGRCGLVSETEEGIRALAIDKDRTPQWNPSSIEDVTPEQVMPFFESPWPAWIHPLKDLA